MVMKFGLMIIHGDGSDICNKKRQMRDNKKRYGGDVEQPDVDVADHPDEVQKEGDGVLQLGCRRDCRGGDGRSIR